MSTNQSEYSVFFLVYALVLFALVFLGFAPTFFLHSLTDDSPPLTGFQFLHGSVLTGWFVLLVIQAELIRQQNRSLHRRLGYFGAVCGIFIMAGALLAPFARVLRIVDTGATLDTDLAHVIAIDEGMGLEQAIGEVAPFGITAIEALSVDMWGSVLSTLAFGLLLGAAVCYRNRSNIHKRLIILASLSLIAPALARIARWPFLGGESGPFGGIAIIVLVGVLIGHELFAKQKIHMATLLGSVALLGAVLWPIGEREFWQPLLRALA